MRRIIDAMPGKTFVEKQGFKAIMILLRTIKDLSNRTSLFTKNHI